MKNWIDQYVQLLSDRDLDSIDVRITEANCLKKEHLPRSLFNFCRFTEKDHALTNVQERQFYLQPASQFNDPYDSHCRIDMEALLMATPIERVMQANPDLLAIPEPQSELKTGADMLAFGERRLAQEFGPEQAAAAMRDLLTVMGELNDRAAKEKIVKIQTGTKVCCFCARPVEESFLMWSHYADYHRGFCVEYDPTEFPLHILHPILYTDTFFDATPYLLEHMRSDDVNPLLILIGAAHKHPDWAYEQEWRIVFPKGGDGGLAIPAPPPRAIYAGARILDSRLQQLHQLAADIGVPLYKMQLDQHRYLLSPIRL